MKKPIMLCAWLCTVVSGLATGQSAATLEDLLRWFPDGLYSTVVHFDKTRYLDTCPGGLRRGFVDKCLDAVPFESGNLPPSFGTSYSSVTSASIGKLALKRCFELSPDGEVIPVNRKTAIGFTLNGRPYGSWNWTHRVQVYRFDDLNVLMREAVERAQLISLDMTAGGRLLYTYRLPGRDDSRYCYATDTGEFLVADSKEHLQAMIATGLAGDIPMMQKLDLREVSDEISDRTYLWSFNTDLPFYQATIDYIYLKDPQSPSIPVITDEMQHMRQHVILALHWEEKGNVSSRSFRFAGAEEAQQYYRDLSGNDPRTVLAHWQTEYINGGAYAFRGTVMRIHEIRMETGADFRRRLAGTRVVERCVDGPDTLRKLMEFVTGGKVRR